MDPVSNGYIIPGDFFDARKSIFNILYIYDTAVYYTDIITVVCGVEQ